MTRPAAAALVPLFALLAADCGARAPARSFAELQQRVRPGHTLYVIDSTGQETRGRLTALSTSSLTMDVDGSVARFDAPQVTQVQRYGDSLWNGVLIGAAIALPGTLIGDPPYGPCERDPLRQCPKSKAASQLLGLAAFGGLGAGIDALVRSRHQVYLGRPPSGSGGIVVRPFLAPVTAGVAITVNGASPHPRGRMPQESDRPGRGRVRPVSRSPE